MELSAEEDASRMMALWGLPVTSYAATIRCACGEELQAQYSGNRLWTPDFCGHCFRPVSPETTECVRQIVEVLGVIRHG